MEMKLAIPEWVEFADLKLTRDPATGDVSFDWAPIEAICIFYSNRLIEPASACNQLTTPSI